MAWKTGLAATLLSTITLVSIGTSSVVSAKDVTDARVIGEAYHLKNGTLLYREYYSPQNARSEVQVTYQNPQDETIAIKTLFYSNGENRANPGFILKDVRDDSILGARWQGDQLLLSRSGRSSVREKSITPEPPVVIDAGFDDYIQQQWDRLLRGDRVRFNFAFPNRLTSVVLTAQAVPAANSPLAELMPAQGDWHYFKIDVANRMMALFADTIHLAYDKSNKRLQAYQGRSNLTDNDGGSWDVRIQYRYTDDD